MYRKTAKEIILETVEFYKTNKRGVDGGQCKYFSDGNMCAVGRCLINAEKFQIDVEFLSSKGIGFHGTAINSLANNFGMDTNSYLREEYKDQPMNFWAQLQLFHDVDKNWIKTDIGNELSSEGELYLNSILKDWEER